METLGSGAKLHPQLGVTLQLRSQFLTSGTVHDIELTRCIHEANLLGLSVDRHLLPDDLRQLVRGDLGPSQQSPGATRRDVSGADDLTVLNGSAQVIDAISVRNIENGLDDGSVATMANQSGVGLVPQQQADAGDDHRLAGTRLAGHRCQRGRRLEDSLVNDTQPANPDTANHELSPG